MVYENFACMFNDAPNNISMCTSVPLTDISGSNLVICNHYGILLSTSLAVSITIIPL